MDRMHLIAEIFSRPALWDLQSEEHKSRGSIPLLWQEVAARMGPDVTVEECKRKWKNLRDAYRAEIKRLKLRIERDMLKGTYNPDNDYTSKWAYFEHMKFIKDIKSSRRKKLDDILNSTASNDNYDDENDLEQFAELHNIDDIKFESDMTLNNEECLPGEKDDTSESQFYNAELTKGSAEERHDEIKDATYRSAALNLKLLEDNSSKPKRSNEEPLSRCCRCPKRSHDQIHDSEDRENEHQTLMKSAHLDLKRCERTRNWESDYNFLISFLPQIQKMNEWQNLNFRAKMSDFIFNIMSQPLNCNQTPVSPL